MLVNVGISFISLYETEINMDSVFYGRPAFMRHSKSHPSRAVRTPCDPHRRSLGFTEPLDSDADLAPHPSPWGSGPLAKSGVRGMFHWALLSGGAVGFLP